MDLGTAEQLRKPGRTMLGTKRGEVKKVYVISVLDVLADWGIITEIQKNYGEAYWRLKEMSLQFLAIAPAKIYGEAIADHSEWQETVSHEVIKGASTEIWLILNKMLLPHYREALKACCYSVHDCPPVRVVQVFGENTIVSAFEALERFHPLAARELDGKL